MSKQTEALKLALEALEDRASLMKWQIARDAVKEALAQQNEFNPDWDAMAVMVEEQQRMAKRIAELEAQRKPLTDKQIGAILEDPNIAEPHQGNWLVLPYAYARAIEAAHGIKE